MTNTLLALVILPFIGAFITFVVGKVYEKLSFWSAWSISLILFIITLKLYFNYNEPITIDTIWFSLGEFTIPFGLYIDKLSLVMLLIATGLGFLDIHFAHDYMKQDPNKPRYYSKVIFFIGGMILLVSAKDMISLFVGWEFMGLASYLLISFWHQQKDPADAGVSAFLFTRFGDIFLFASIGILFYTTGTFNLIELNALASNGDINHNILYICAIFIFIAAIGKSGQFPLFPWLMRAMEGPTTVSALIHGATMVNSGIYIVARLFDFYIASEALIVVATFGAISAFIGATSALVQKELKKVLAYSTMSHLSLAFIGLGAGSLAAGMSHLVNHAVFKALLFLGAGAVILSASHIKDMFRFGGFSKKMLLVSIAMGFGVLSLSGIPPFSGFYSKDMIIATTLSNQNTYGLISTLTLIAGVLSIAYILRLWLLTFVSQPKDIELYGKVEAPSFFWITLPLIIMAIITFSMGFFQENIISMITTQNIQKPDIENLTFWLIGIITLLAYIVYYYYVKRFDITQKISSQPLMKTIHKILFNGYFIEFFIHYFIKNIVINSISKSISWFDIYIIDHSINSSKIIALKSKQNLSKLYSSYTTDSSGFMILGVIIFLCIILLGGVV